MAANTLRPPHDCAYASVNELALTSDSGHLIGLLSSMRGLCSRRTRVFAPLATLLLITTLMAGWGGAHWWKRQSRLESRPNIVDLISLEACDSTCNVKGRAASCKDQIKDFTSNGGACSIAHAYIQKQCDTCKSCNLAQVCKVAATTQIATTTPTVHHSASSQEWEVIASEAKIWKSPKLSAKHIGTKKRGELFLGEFKEVRQQNKSEKWVQLKGEPGYVITKLADADMIRKRHVVYSDGSSGGCGNDKFPITSPIICEAAATALSFAGTKVRFLKSVPFPGCFHRAGALWMSIQPASHESGTAGAWKPMGAWHSICSTKEYPEQKVEKPHEFNRQDCHVFVPAATPSLYCWSIMMHATVEEDLIKDQLQKRVGIFGCNDYAVLSNAKVWIGNDDCDRSIYTWLNKAPTAHMGKFGAGADKTRSFLNTLTFMQAWDILTGSQMVWKHDFIVKVDPDAVMFADRLRDHVKPHMGKAIYFRNCWLDEDVGKKGGLLYGAVEIISQKALGSYHAWGKKCKDLDWHGWGEDLWMQNCMDAIKVNFMKDFNLVQDLNCNFPPCPGCDNPCTDISRAAYHPFKDVASYWHCWRESIEAPR